MGRSASSIMGGTVFWMAASISAYRELHAIREDLEDLRHRVKDMAGYRKEIDYA
jgi:hypothetical protein